MNVVVILLRLIHIFAGVFWAGASFVFLIVVLPTARAAGQEGMRFFVRLISGERYLRAIAISAGLTVLAGLILYFGDAGNNIGTFMAYGFGMALTIGGIAGLIAFAIGITILMPTSRRIGALMNQIQSAGGPPSPAQQTQMQVLQMRSARGSIALTLLVTIAVAAMAIARYV
jgi:hypothetical protein